MKKLLSACLCLCLPPGGCGRAGRRYSVDYCGRKSAYSGARNRYRPGETVVLYYKWIATDTDYSFCLDGEALPFTYDGSRGFRIEFTMPEHDVKLECRWKNTMEYIPPDR